MVKSHLEPVSTFCQHEQFTYIVVINVKMTVLVAVLVKRIAFVVKKKQPRLNEIADRQKLERKNQVHEFSLSCRSRLSERARHRVVNVLMAAMALFFKLCFL